MKKIEFYTKYIHTVVGLWLLSLASCAPTTDPNPKQDINPEFNLQRAAQLNVKLGFAYLQDEQLNRAKTKFNRALRLDPNLPEVHYGLGFYFERVGEIDSARQAYQKAIALNPNGGKEHNNYGAFLCRQQEYRASEKEFMQALRDPNYLNVAEALENAGLCVLPIPDEPKAIEYFKRALSHDAKRPHALIELAYIHYAKNDFEGAQQYYKQYTKIQEPTARSMWLGIQLAHRADNHAEVSTQVEQLKKQFPLSKEYQEVKQLK